MVAAYPRDARGYFAAPRPSSIGALRSARLRRLYPPQRPKTGETTPLLSPLLLLRAGDEGAAATRWAARKAHGWAGLVLLCTFGTARSLAMALSSLATCFVHPPHPAAAPPHPTPAHPTPQSQGADGHHLAQADRAGGGASVPGDPGATSVALVVWLNRRHRCFATFCYPR